MRLARVAFIGALLAMLGACTRPTPLIKCKTDADCPTRTICYTGFCVLPDPPDAAVGPDAGAIARGAAQVGIVTGGGVAKSSAYKMVYTVGQPGAGASESAANPLKSGTSQTAGSTP